RGWTDLFRQLLIWFGFIFAYQLARGFADRNPAKAFSDGLGVINFEKHAHSLFELSLQRVVDSSHFLATMTYWTYWLSQFAIVGITLAVICRRRIFKVLWLLWPAWVWFSVMATGNHFWLDCLAGAMCAGVAAAIVYARPLKQRLTRNAPETA